MYVSLFNTFHYKNDKKEGIVSVLCVVTIKSYTRNLAPVMDFVLT